MSRISGNDILIVIKNCHNTQSVGATHSHNAKSRRIPEWVSHRQIDARLITQLNKTVKMRHMRIYTFFLLLATFLSSYAYDFKQGNLYYKILSEEELTVATAENNDIRNPTYSGDIEIPSHVTYNGKTYTVTEIGGFANSPKVTSVTIPETAVKITHFYGGSSGSQGSGWIVKSISGPGGNGGQTSDGESSLKEIRFNAVNCTSCGFFSMGIPGMSQVTSWSYPFPPSVERIIIGPKVTCLPDYAFYLCTKVKSLTIPASITKIGKNIIKTESTDPVCQLSELYVEATDFTNKWVLNDPSIVRWKTTTFTSGLASFINPAAIAYTSYDLTVPEGFTTIKKGTFKNDTKLNSIVFPSTITEIGDSAFFNCGVVAVTFAGQSQLKTIGDMAFKDSYKLSSIEIPNSLTEIGEYAFYNSAIESLTFAEPSQLNTIGKSVFGDCAKLKSVTLPNSLTEIGPSAFDYCKSLETIQFPDNIKGIDNFAFSGCKFKSINIPPSCEYLGYGAFYNNKNLQEMIISDGEKPLSMIPQIGDEYYSFDIGTPKYVYIGRKIKQEEVEGKKLSHTAFLYTQTIEIGEGITEIENGAFQFSYSLQTVILPESLITIGEDAFYYCKKLTSVTLPLSLQEIGANAFYQTGLLNISIPASINRIGERAFSGLINIVIETGNNPLYLGGSIDAENIYVGRNLEGYAPKDEESGGWRSIYCDNLEIGNRIDQLPNSAFYYNYRLKSVKLPDTILSIGEYAFGRCENLTSINIPKRLRTLGAYAFIECPNIESLTLPETLTKIERYTFYNCTSLKSISIPCWVNEIDQQAFYGCSGLNSLEIGFSVEKIAARAFTGCPNLTEISVNRAMPPNAPLYYLDFECTQTGYLLFDEEVYGKATLSVPDGCIDGYKATAPWNKFFNIREAAIDDVIVDSESGVIAREYYSIDGRMLGDRLPSVPGHYIECLRHADGNVVTNKIAVR